MVSQSWARIVFVAAVTLVLALALVGRGSGVQVPPRGAEPQHARRASRIELDGAESARAGRAGVARAFRDVDLDQVLVLVLDKLNATVFVNHPERESGSLHELEASAHRARGGARAGPCSAVRAANEERDDGICKP